MDRAAPEIRWSAVLGGGAATLFLAVGLSLGAASAGSAALAGAAPWVAIALGAAAAGRLAASAGALHGGLVAVLWIVADTLAAPTAPAVADVVSDTVRTIAFDAVWLAIGAALGWLGSRSAGGS